MNQLAVPTTYQQAMILGRTPRDAFAELKRRQRAGEVASAGPLRMITKGAHTGQYAIPATIIVAPRENELHKRLIATFSARLEEGGPGSEDFLHLIFVARSLERIGDLAVNIGEDAVYLDSARDIRHDKSRTATAE